MLSPRPLRAHRAAVGIAAVLFAACASAPPPYNPGEPDAAGRQRLAACERAYREQVPDYPQLRDELAKDPVLAGWWVRVLVHDLFTVREGRPLGRDEDLLRAAAKIENPVEVRALAELKTLGARAVPTIVGDLLRHPQPQPRELGVEVIGTIGAPALPALAELAREGEPRFRRAAARAYGAMPPSPETLSALRALASDGEYTVRADALRGLRGGGPEAGQLLRERLVGDRDPFVRRQAARSLVECREPATATALVDYLDRCQREQDAAGERNAQESLAGLAGTKGPRTVEAWRKWARDWRPAGR